MRWSSSDSSSPTPATSCVPRVAIIKAEVELAQSGTTKGDELQRSDDIDRRGNRPAQSRLTEQLLLLAAADEHQLSLSRESITLRGLLDEVAERGPGACAAPGSKDHRGGR